MVGQKIHNLRKTKGLTLQQLSQASGLSIAFLSQVEREQNSPSVSSLANVAKALGVPPSYFFPPPDKEGLLVRSYTRQPFSLDDAHVVYTRLGGEFPDRDLDPYLITLPPHYEGETVQHEGEEFIYVLFGHIVMYVAKETYRLHRGDSIQYKSALLHTLHNPSDEPAQLLVVNTPRIF